MYSPSDTGLRMAWGGSLFTLVSNKRRRAKLRVLFKSFPGPLLKSGMGPLARHKIGVAQGGVIIQVGLKRRDPKRGHYSSQLLGHY